MNSHTPANTEPGHEFRHFRFEGTVRLFSGTAMWNSTLIDLSLKGMLIERPGDWAPAVRGSRYRLDLRLEGGIMISMGAALADDNGQRLAFECSKIDLNSFAQLKRLIELNLGNVELLNREISALGG